MGWVNGEFAWTFSREWSPPDAGPFSVASWVGNDTPLI